MLVAALLRAHGFVGITAHAAGQKGKDDEGQLEYAVSLQRTILTHNRNDFAQLAQSYFASGKKHYGIIIAVRRPPQEIVARLLAVLNRTTADEMEDQLIYI